MMSEEEIVMSKKEWEEAGNAFESSLMILRKDKNGWVIGFSVHPDEAPEALLDAPLGTRFMQVLFQIGDDEKPVPKIDSSRAGAKPEIDDVVDFNAARKKHDPVAIAGRLCRTPFFQGWILAEDLSRARVEGEEISYDIKKMEEMSASKLKDILGIDSRSELRSNAHAKQAFMSLFEKFKEFQMEYDN
jgi:hypothetical protein